MFYVYLILHLYGDIHWVSRKSSSANLIRGLEFVALPVCYSVKLTSGLQFSHVVVRRIFCPPPRSSSQILDREVSSTGDIVDRILTSIMSSESNPTGTNLIHDVHGDEEL